MSRCAYESFDVAIHPRLPLFSVVRCNADGLKTAFHGLSENGIIIHHDLFHLGQKWIVITSNEVSHALGNPSASRMVRNTK